MTNTQIYSQLKNNYRALYRSIFYRVTLQPSFQNGNQSQRLETLRKARYLFLMAIINNGMPNAEDAVKLIPNICFNDRPMSQVKELNFIPDNRIFVYNRFKNN